METRQLYTQAMDLLPIFWDAILKYSREAYMVFVRGQHDRGEAALEAIANVGVVCIRGGWWGSLVWRKYLCSILVSVLMVSIAVSVI